MNTFARGLSRRNAHSSLIARALRPRGRRLTEPRSQRRHPLRSLKQVVACTVAAIVASSTALASAPQARAFSGFTHASASGEVWIDASDGQLTLLGGSYRVRDELRQVFSNPENRPYWNAGAIGPDAFPDIAVGQMSIHPPPSGNGGTGIWLGHLLDRAWRAQADPRYSPAERQQILAFTYGFLSHASGDIWGHTLVNEFARGTFPPWSEAIRDAAHGDTRELAIIARHLFTEGYITDATPGYDGTRGESEVRLQNGSLTDDGSPAVPLKIPSRWIYESMLFDSPALVGPDSTSPAALAFSKLRKLVAQLPAKTVCYEVTKEVPILGEVKVGRACATLAIITRWLGFPHYFRDWVDAINRAEEEYPNLSLGIAQGIFDPSTRREAQNQECANAAEWRRLRCIAGVGRLDAVKFAAHSYLIDRLTPALLSPFAKYVYDLAEPIRYAVLVELNAVLAEAYPWLAATGIPKTYEELKERVQEIAVNSVSDALGVDLEDLASLMDSPSSKMDLTRDYLHLHGVPSSPAGLQLALFETTDHAKLDGYLGIAVQHATSTGGGLDDDVSYDPARVAVYRNTVTLAKLALLDGPELDRLLSDLIGAKKPYTLYAKERGANVMTTVLPGANRAQPFQWLLSLDGDHAWRDGSALPAGSKELTLNVSPARDAANRVWIGAGAGNFPLYESCALRPKFSTLFADWEQDTVEKAKAQRLGQEGRVEAFAALGDQPAGDPNDPDPPAINLVAGGSATSVDGATVLDDGSTVSLDGADDFWQDSSVTVESRWIAEGSSTDSEFTPTANHARLAPPRGEGRYVLEARASDPCHQGATVAKVFSVKHGSSTTWVFWVIGTLAAAIVIVVLRLRHRRI